MSQNDSMSDRRLVEEGLLVIVFLSRYLDWSKPTVPSESEVTQLFGGLAVQSCGKRT
jgi:hypothetical protein